MKLNRKISALALALTLGILGSACSQGTTSGTTVTSGTAAGTVASDTAAAGSSEETATAPAESETTVISAERPTEDRAGNPLTLPETVSRIAALNTATVEVLVELGLADKIVAVDLYASGMEGIPADIPAIDMMAPDIETLLASEPDLVLASNISDAGGSESVFQPLIDSGIAVAYLPTANSLKDIEEDLLFIGAVSGAAVEAEALADDMRERLDKIGEVASAIPEEERKTVLFEISALPAIYSTGSGTFLHEVIELAGGINVLADQTSWVPVTEEAAISLNPDVILTNVNYLEDAAGEIKARAGWETVTAVAGGDVYYIDNSDSSLPNHHVADAAEAIAHALYPEYFD